MSGEYDQRMFAAIQRIEERLDEQHKLLVGNGHIGLCEQVRRNQEGLAALRDMVMRRWSWSIVLFGVGGVLWLWHAVGGDPGRIPGLVLKWLGG